MSKIDKIIKIQSIIRKYLVRKKYLIPSSYYQTKIWRKKQKWYKGGKHNECEKYQISLLEKITQQQWNKTNYRLNIITFNLVNKIFPLKNINGLEFTENFDGIIKTNNFYYFNLKFICDSGGAQTRNLRDVYHFLYYQLEHLIKYKTTNIYFLNILDGDTFYNNIDKLKFLVNKKRYNKIKKYLFIGDMFTFQKFWILKNI